MFNADNAVKPPIRYTVVLAILLLANCATSRADDYATQYAAFARDMRDAWSAAEFAVVRPKTALSSDDISPSMTVNEELPSLDERQAMLRWADKLAGFKSRADAMVRAAVSAYLAPLIIPIAERHDRRQIDLAVAIYQGKLTWGKYNSYRVESLQLKQREIDEIKAGLQLAGAVAAANAPPPSSRSLTTVEWFLLQQQQAAPLRPVNCSSFQRGQWISTTCF